MKYKIPKTLKFGTSVCGRARNRKLGGEAAHQLGVVKDPSYLLPCNWSFEGDGVAAAGVIIEVNPNALDCQGFTRLEKGVSFRQIKYTA